MSLLKMIASYDQEREAYITHLEEEVARLNEANNELTRLMMDGIAIRERQTLDLILAGALRKPEEAP